MLVMFQSTQNHSYSFLLSILFKLCHPRVLSLGKLFPPWTLNLPPTATPCHYKYRSSPWCNFLGSPVQSLCCVRLVLTCLTSQVAQIHCKTEQSVSRATAQHVGRQLCSLPNIAICWRYQSATEYRNLLVTKNRSATESCLAKTPEFC